LILLSRRTVPSKLAQGLALLTCAQKTVSSTLVRFCLGFFILPWLLHASVSFLLKMEVADSSETLSYYKESHPRTHESSNVIQVFDTILLNSRFRQSTMHSGLNTVTDGVSTQFHVPHCALDRTLGRSLLSDVKNKNPSRGLIAGRTALIHCLGDTSTPVPYVASEIVRNHK